MYRGIHIKQYQYQLMSSKKKKCILYIPNLALMETDGTYDDIHMSENHGYIRGYEWNIRIFMGL